MYRYFIVLFVFLLVGCSGQTKEEMLQQGNGLRDQGNHRGAIVLYRSALEKDANYTAARMQLAETYLQTGDFNKAEKEFQKVQLQTPGDSNILLKLAAVNIQKRLPEKALLDLDKFHETEQETAESLVLYGLAYGSSGDLVSAKDFFNKALQLDQDSIDARMNLAKIYLQKKDYPAAKTYLQQLLVLDKKNIQAYYLLAQLETQAGQTAAALVAYHDLLAVDSKQLHALYMSGMLQMDLGDLDAAQLTVNQSLASFPDRPETLRLQGIFLYRQENYPEAVLALQNSLKSQQHLLTYFFLGLSHYAQAQYELALNQFQKALDLAPGFERARVLVAMTLLKQKRLDDAIVEIRKVIKNNPNSAHAHNILGSALLATGQYDEGMAALETATELDPSLADAHLKRGVLHLAKGEQGSGEADLVKAIAAAPELLNSRLLLVTHYLRQKNYTDAIKLLHEGMNGSRSDALLNNYLAAAYFAQKNSDDAVKSLLRAKEANPDYLTPYFNLASYYTSQSDYAKALAEFQQVSAKDDKNIRALLGMASLYSVQGQDDELEKTFQQIEATGTERGFVTAAQFQLKRNNSQEALLIANRGLELHKGSVALLEIKGGLLLREKQVVEAEAVFKQIAQLSPGRGYGLLTQLYLATGQQPKAELLVAELLAATPDQDYPYLLSAAVALVKRDLDTAIKGLQHGLSQVKNPLRLQMRLGQLYAGSGKLQQAEQVFQRVIETNPRHAEAYLMMGTTKERLGDKGGSLDYYRSTVKLDRRNVMALNNLAYLLTENFGEAKEALDYAMQAYRLQPGDPRIMDTLAFVLLKNGKGKEAVSLLEKAHQMLPDVATVTLHLAMAKKQLGDKDAARTLLQQIIAEGQGDDVAQAKKLLKSL